MREAGVVGPTVHPLFFPSVKCGDPLVLAPHTIMCMAVESFTEGNRGTLHVPVYISL